jgi:Electron transfer DM13
VRRKRVLIPLGIVLAAALTFGLVWFQPWKLWVDHRVDEALPAVALSPAAQSAGSTRPPSTTATTATPRADAVLLERGTLISHEHATHGTVSVVRQPDGRRVLAIANLSTSDGPDVHVWLTDARVVPGSNGWHVFDDGRHISLGRLKGNLGNQVYPIPDNADLALLTSVSIWCERFDVSFGAAELAPVAG